MEFNIQFQDADFHKLVNAIRFIIANKNRVLKSEASEICCCKKKKKQNNFKNSFSINNIYSSTTCHNYWYVLYGFGFNYG